MGETGMWLLIVAGGIALVAEFIDSSLGMGYGTSLTPVLILMGFDVRDVVPAVLLSELFTGLLAAFGHHRAGNVNFRLTPENYRAEMSSGGGSLVLAVRRAIPRQLKAALLLGGCSIAGTITAVLLAVKVNRTILNTYIGVMVLSIGLFLLIRRNKVRPFSWGRLTCCGLLASFNKGLSGGGYGPIVTGGQLLAGVEGRQAVAITSLAEGLTCAVGVTIYLLTRPETNWWLAPVLCIGAILSVPLSVLSVRRIPTRRLNLAIAIATTVLGCVTLYKVLA